MRLIDEQAFDEVFDRSGNKTRLNIYDEQRGPWQMTYRYNGELGITTAKTRQQCRQMTLVKTGGNDYEELSMEAIQ